MSAIRKPVFETSQQMTVRDTATRERFGGFDKRGDWQGRPEELGSDDVILDHKLPKDVTRVQRVQTGAMALHQSGRIGDVEVIAADRWCTDWSRGTGHPGQTSEMRFLGVSLGGASASDGIATSKIDAATRHREAAQAVGKRASDRLLAFLCLGLSINAASKLMDVSRQDLGGLLIGDLERLGEHYRTVDNRRDASRKRSAVLS